MKLLSVIFTSLFAVTAFSSVVTVPIDYLTIMDAVDNSQHGDTINVLSGNYNEDWNEIYNRTIRSVSGAVSLSGGSIYCSGCELVGIDFSNYGFMADNCSIKNCAFVGLESGFAWIRFSEVSDSRFMDLVESASMGVMASTFSRTVFSNIHSNQYTQLFINSDTSEFINCVFYNCTSGEPLSLSGVEMIRNCVFLDVVDVYFNSGYTVAVYSNLEHYNGSPPNGAGNISIDPMFLDPQNGNFTLQPSSPCIDAGDPASPLDPDGTIADMGAFSYCQGNEISLPDEHRLTAEPGYPEQFSISLTSACDPVQVDSARTMTADFSLVDGPDSVEGEFKTGQFLLSFAPPAQGLYTDTLHIWANTEISNTEDPRHHVVPLIGEAGPIPAPVTDLSISILEDLSAQLTWSPVDTTIYGNPVTPDWYLVFYNEQDPLDDSDWYYQGAVAGSEYTHFLAAQFADVMNYRVVAWKGIDPAILGLEVGSSAATTELLLD